MLLSLHLISRLSRLESNHQRALVPNNEASLFGVPIVLSFKYVEIEAVQHATDDDAQLINRKILSDAVPRTVAKWLEYRVVIVLETFIVKWVRGGQPPLRDERLRVLEVFGVAERCPLVDGNQCLRHCQYRWHIAGHGKKAGECTG